MSVTLMNTLCPHFNDGYCGIATALVHRPCPTTAAACKACENSPAPRTLNAVTVSLAIREARQSQAELVPRLLDEHRSLIRAAAPSLSARAVSFAQATSVWLAAGRPLRDEAEVARIYNAECGPCEQREPTSDPEVSWCCKCGCRLSRNPQVLNKILLATEHCPLGKW